MGFYPPDSLVQEAARSGVEVLPPDINSSRVDCITEWPEIEQDETRPRRSAVRIGLGYVKGAKQTEMEELVAERDRNGRYLDLGDLSSRMPIRRQDLEQLAWAGALRSLPQGGRVSGLWNVGLTLDSVQNSSGRQLSLPFGSGETPELQEPTDWARVRAEYGSIGMTLEGHPMALLRPTLQDHVKDTVAAAGLADRSQAEVVGLLVAKQKPETAGGTIFLLIEDEFGTLNLITPPRVAERYRLVIRTATLLRARGRIETNQGVVNLIVNSLTEIEPPDPTLKALAPVGQNFGRRER